MIMNWPFRFNPTTVLFVGSRHPPIDRAEPHLGKFLFLLEVVKTGVTVVRLQRITFHHIRTIATDRSWSHSCDYSTTNRFPAIARLHHIRANRAHSVNLLRKHRLDCFPSLQHSGKSHEYRARFSENTCHKCRLQRKITLPVQHNHTQVSQSLC